MSWLDKSCLQLVVKRKDKAEPLTFQVHLTSNRPNNRLRELNKTERNIQQRFMGKFFCFDGNKNIRLCNKVFQIWVV